MANISPVEILLVEDNAADVRLTIEALKEGMLQKHVSVVRDGVEALEFLHRSGPYADAPRPDLIFLDLNLPRKDGREVLAELKRDPTLRQIPVIVLTTSRAERDVARSYDLHGNCYITKPLDLIKFMMVLQSVERFWLSLVTLPPS